MPTLIPITFDTLESALQWSSAGGPFDNEALLSRTTGEMFFRSTYGDSDEELPDDIDDGAAYVAVPHKNELDLGRDLVFAFAAEHAPMHSQTIKSFFRQRGAYARLKAFLESTQLLDRWHAYEAEATRRALEAWAGENGFVVVDEVNPLSASDTP